MPKKKLLLKMKQKSTKALSKNSKKLSKNIQGATFKFGDLFSFSTKAAAKTNFVSNLEYKNLTVDIKGNVKNKKANLNIRIEGKNFSFKSEIVITEKTFRELYILFDHLLSNITKR